MAKKAADIILIRKCVCMCYTAATYKKDCECWFNVCIMVWCYTLPFLHTILKSFWSLSPTNFWYHYVSHCNNAICFKRCFYNPIYLKFNNDIKLQVIFDRYKVTSMYFLSVARCAIDKHVTWSDGLSNVGWVLNNQFSWQRWCSSGRRYFLAGSGNTSSM